MQALKILVGHGMGEPYVRIAFGKVQRFYDLHKGCANTRFSPTSM
ncbi:MAG: hypothetical protein JETT_3267 [Candidatus Jettenia ecosi]|uniref:Uncharacterized protein n=1 Tax=Candidatus Jettenia ecosi TaxID=2494326 RepID=A0A533Q7A5_9BACT|nr:MAG: hypothetical protein JETT_3267 [Candidatus Jettenia ecosi]